MLDGRWKSIGNDLHDLLCLNFLLAKFIETIDFPTVLMMMNIKTLNTSISLFAIFMISS